MRTAWIILGSLFTAASLVAVTVQAVALLAHEETVEQRAWNAAGIATIEIRNSTGDVDVTGADVPTIELRSEISRGLFDTEHSERIDGDRLVLTTDCPEVINHFCRVDQELVVPRGVAVEIVSYDGNTSVADVDGDVNLFSEDGRVDLARLAGDLDLEIRNGNAQASQLTARSVALSSEFGRVDLSFAEAPEEIVVDARFGDVEIAVPDDGRSYAVTSRTEFGRTDVELRTDPASDSRIEVHAGFGRVTLRYGA